MLCLEGNETLWDVLLQGTNQPCSALHKFVVDYCAVTERQ